MKYSKRYIPNHGLVSVAVAPTGFNKFRNQITTAPTNYVVVHNVSVTSNPQDYGLKYANFRPFCPSQCIYFYIRLRARSLLMYFSGSAQQYYTKYYIQNYYIPQLIPIPQKLNSEW